MGPHSVTYLVFTLDITSIYHAKMYLDDYLLLTKPKPGQTLQDAVLTTMEKVEDYTNSNLLALNPDKSRIMIMSNGKTMKENIEVTIGGKVLHHQNHIMMLRNYIPAQSNRARILKQTTHFMDQQFRRNYATTIFEGKFNIAIY